VLRSHTTSPQSRLWHRLFCSCFGEAPSTSFWSELAAVCLCSLRPWASSSLPAELPILLPVISHCDVRACSCSYLSHDTPPTSRHDARYTTGSCYMAVGMGHGGHDAAQSPRGRVLHIAGQTRLYVRRRFKLESLWWKETKQLVLPQNHNLSVAQQYGIPSRHMLPQWQ